MTPQRSVQGVAAEAGFLFLLPRWLALRCFQDGCPLQLWSPAAEVAGFPLILGVPPVGEMAVRCFSGWPVGVLGMRFPLCALVVGVVARSVRVSQYHARDYAHTVFPLCALVVGVVARLLRVSQYHARYYARTVLPLCAHILGGPRGIEMNGPTR